MQTLGLYIGHRGLAAQAPENTMAGIRAAKAAGFSWVEIDVRLSKDQEAVLSHDDNLQRCCGLPTQVESLTTAELAQVPANCGFVQFNEHVPGLKEILALLHKLQLGVVIETKPDKGNEQQVIQAVATAISTISPAMMISSFNQAMLLAAKEHLPDIPRALNVNQPDQPVFEQLAAVDAANLHCGKNTDADIISQVADANYGVYCFTADSANEAKQLVAAGAHGVFTSVSLG